MADDNRPDPIKRAEETTGRITAVVGSLVGAAATFAILTPTEAALAGDLLTSTNGAVPGIAAALVALFGMGSSLVSMIATRLRAKPQVTPITDPRDDRGVALVREGDGLRPVANGSTY